MTPFLPRFSCTCARHSSSNLQTANQCRWAGSVKSMPRSVWTEPLALCCSVLAARLCKSVTASLSPQMADHPSAHTHMPLLPPLTLSAPCLPPCLPPSPSLPAVPPAVPPPPPPGRSSPSQHLVRAEGQVHLRPQPRKDARKLHRDVPTGHSQGGWGGTEVRRGCGQVCGGNTKGVEKGMTCREGGRACMSVCSCMRCTEACG